MAARSPVGPGHEADGDALISDINVTPMVDVMLVLLIIFMVTATLIVRPSITVDLPKASRADQAVQTSVGLTLKADGTLLLNGRSLGERQLYQHLKGRTKKQKTLQAIIAGDDRVPHGRVVRVIDILRRAGVTRFAINVEVDEAALEDLE
jgi:biopolymer transport protein ExbD